MNQTALKCPNCGATAGKNGQAFKNLSGLNTHINLHCDKKPAKEMPAVGCPKGGEHVFGLLNSNHAVMLAAINAGHTKACRKCGDLV